MHKSVASLEGGLFRVHKWQLKLHAAVVCMSAVWQSWMHAL